MEEEDRRKQRIVGAVRVTINHDRVGGGLHPPAVFPVMKGEAASQGFIYMGSTTVGKSTFYLIQET